MLKDSTVAEVWGHRRLAGDPGPVQDRGGRYKGEDRGSRGRESCLIGDLCEQVGGEAA